MFIKLIYRFNTFFLFFGLVFLFLTILSFYFCNQKLISKNQSLSFLNAAKEQNINDIYNEDIAKIDKIQNIIEIIDIRVKEKNNYNISKEIQQIARESFVHGLSFLYPCENWFLYMIANIPISIIQEKNLNAIYETERQLRTPVAFCSQNALLIQSLLRHYNIEFSSVAVGDSKIGHFASAAKINDEWYYLDGNIEYKLINNELTKLNDFLDPNNEKLINKMFSFHPDFAQSIINGVKTGETYQFDINQVQAKKGLLFQKFTKIISNFGWLFFLIIYFIIFIYKYYAKIKI